MGVGNNTMWGVAFRVQFSVHVLAHGFVFMTDPTYSLHCSSFFLVNQKLYYGILTIKLVNQKRNYNGDYR